ncbi:MAG: hypothetical protein ACOX69_05385 [Coriobacteriales bacterium]|jgi:hypothetical protein
MKLKNLAKGLEKHSGRDIPELTDPLTCAFFLPYMSTAPKNEPFLAIIATRFTLRPHPTAQPQQRHAGRRRA